MLFTKESLVTKYIEWHEMDFPQIESSPTRPPALLADCRLQVTEYTNI